MSQPKAQTARNAAAAAGALLAASKASPPTPLSLADRDSGERTEQASSAAASLEAQKAHASDQVARLIVRRSALRAHLEEQCREAEAQHEALALALQALARVTACLADGSNKEPSPLLGADLPDSYASACQTLLDSLAGFLQHNFLAAENAASSSSARPAALELEQLQICAIKAERLRIQDEAELARWSACAATGNCLHSVPTMSAATHEAVLASRAHWLHNPNPVHPLLRCTLLACRLQAELKVLGTPAATAGAASLGYTTADLQAEVASLERRRDASLQAAVAQAEATAAAAAGAEVVREQAAGRRAALEQRLHAKRQVSWCWSGPSWQGRRVWVDQGRKVRISHHPIRPTRCHRMAQVLQVLSAGLCTAGG